jgi:branched-chain amino acid aminotransferase
MEIEISKTKTPRPKVPVAQLGFGKVFSDHQFTMEYAGGRWGRPKIEPYGPLSLEPAACVLHYSQCLFEGMKAFRGKNGKVRLFRPRFHAERMRDGAARLCMPPVPEELFLESVRKLVALDSDWVPSERGASLYIRPTLIGTESFLGVRPAEKYLYFVITCPVGAYYAEGFNPIKIWVEEEFIRAAAGGLGAIKAGANYASSLVAAVEAKKKGYSQVLWLDARDHSYVEEVGTMNVFFRFREEVVTPPLSGTILNGATRDCVLALLKSWKIPVRERLITLAEVQQAYDKGELLEAFGTGTAAVISPIGELATKGRKLALSGGKPGELTQRLFQEISSIQYGDTPDSFGWVEEL